MTKDRWKDMQMIAGALGLSKLSVHILMGQLDMKEVCAKIMPKVFEPEKE